jgi:hypothetical protein
VSAVSAVWFPTAAGAKWNSLQTEVCATLPPGFLQPEVARMGFEEIRERAGQRGTAFPPTGLAQIVSE